MPEDGKLERVILEPQPLSAPQIVPWLAPLEERLYKRIAALEAEIAELRKQIATLRREKDRRGRRDQNA